MSDEHRVVASTRLIAALTLLSRVLGLLRECAYGYFFGTGVLLSAFRVGFMVPNLARRLFGEGALSAAFIPVFSSALRDRDPDRPARLVGGVLTLISAVLLVIIFVSEVGLLATNAVRSAITLQLTAIMLPFMALICIAALLGGVLNCLGRFAAPAASPILLNLFVIGAILAGARLAGRNGVDLVLFACYAVLAAGVAQVALQWTTLRRAGFRPVFNRQWSTPDIEDIVRFMAPMIVGISTVQFNTLLDMLIAMFLVPDGRGPAILGFAHFLYQLPLGVFGIALATAVFPVLAARAADNDRPGLTRTLEHGLRIGLFISLPASVGLILIADPLVAALFQRGAFGQADTSRVSTALGYYSLGLTAYTLQHLLVRVYYSMKDSRTPVRIAASVVAINLTLNLLLVGPMREAGVALATAISAFIQVIWLAVSLRSRTVGMDRRSLVSSLVRTAVATSVMGLCVWLVVGISSPLRLPIHSNSIRTIIAVVLGLLTMGLTAGLQRAPELRDLLRRRVRSP